MPEQSTKRKPRKVAKQAPLEDDFGYKDGTSYLRLADD